MRKIAITDERIQGEAIRALEVRGFRAITLPSFSRLGEDVCSHTDMLLLKVGDTLFSYADYCDERPYVFDDLYMVLKDRGIKFSFLPETPSEKYPLDAMLNVLIMGNRVFLKRDTASEALIGHFEKMGYEIIGVRQGYPACTVLRLNDEAVITADRGMAKVLSESGIRVTLIDDGYFKLPPHEYGFIGGSCGVDGDTVYFTGLIEGHPCYEKIMDAIRCEGMKAVSLTALAPVDVGGILFC